VSEEDSAHRDDAPTEGEAIAPELLRLIQRVAHREHLLDGVPAMSTRPRTTAPRSTGSTARRRPAIGSVRSAAARATRGTTVRKVTWS
jgi:hypothetical protein